MSSTNNGLNERVPFSQSSSSPSQAGTTRAPDHSPNRRRSGNDLSLPTAFSPTPEPRLSQPTPRGSRRDVDDSMFLTDDEDERRPDTGARRNIAPTRGSARPTNGARRVTAADLQEVNTRPDLINAPIRRTSALQEDRDRRQRSPRNFGRPRSEYFSGADDQPTNLSRLTSLIRPQNRQQNRRSDNSRSRGRGASQNRNIARPPSSSSAATTATGRVNKRRHTAVSNSSQGSLNRHALAVNLTPPAAQLSRPSFGPTTTRPAIDPAVLAMRRTADAQRRAQGQPPVTISISPSPPPPTQPPNPLQPPPATTTASTRTSLQTLQTLLALRTTSYTNLLTRSTTNHHPTTTAQQLQTTVDAELTRTQGSVLSVFDDLVRGGQTGTNGNAVGSDDVLRAVEAWEREQDVRVLMLKRALCEMLRRRVEEGLRDGNAQE